jgi:Flp pilus assembly protein TadD
MKRILIVFLLLGAASFAQNPGASNAESGDDLFKQGQYARAAAAFERLPEPEKTASILNRLGISYHLLGRARDAELAYGRAIKADSDLAAPRNNLGALLYSQRKFSDADSEFRRAADRNSDNTILSENLHLARYARDNTRDARESADRIAATRPLLLETFQNDSGDFLAVVSLLPPGVVLDAAQHALRADVFVARKLYDDAVIAYKRSIAIDRYNANVVNRLGVAYHNLRKLRDAEQQYREALRLRPNHLDAMNNLAVIDYLREDFESALTRYRRALRLQPKSATVLRNMGACLFSLERWDEGMLAYQQALEINPSLFEPQPGGVGSSIQMSQQNTARLNFYLAKIFALRGETDVAISYLFKAVESGFDDAKMIREEQAFKPFASDERFAQVLRVIATAAAAKRS